jgi:hypothetical protein
MSRISPTTAMKAAEIRKRLWESIIMGEKYFSIQKATLKQG